MLAATTSGIATILLYGGRTSHSRFGVPLVLSTSSTSSVGARSRKDDVYTRNVVYTGVYLDTCA